MLYEHTIMAQLVQKQASSHAVAPNGSSTKIVLSPGNPADHLNFLIGMSIVGANTLSGPYAWDMADSTCPQNVSWGDNPVNCILANFTCPAGEYLLIDLALEFRDPAGTWQITVTGPDGTYQTFQNLGPNDPNTGHYHFAYFAQQNLNVGTFSGQPEFAVSATQTATSPDLTKLWRFLSITTSTTTP